MREGISRLPGRHRHVLVRRYGLGGANPITLQRLSAELGISRERVRRLQREGEHMLGTDEQAELFCAVVAWGSKHGKDSLTRYLRNAYTRLPLPNLPIRQ